MTHRRFLRDTDDIQSLYYPAFKLSLIAYLSFYASTQSYFMLFATGVCGDGLDDGDHRPQGKVDGSFRTPLVTSIFNVHPQLFSWIIPFTGRVLKFLSFSLWILTNRKALKVYDDGSASSCPAANTKFRDSDMVVDWKTYEILLQKIQKRLHFFGLEYPRVIFELFTASSWISEAVLQNVA